MGVLKIDDSGDVKVVVVDGIGLQGVPGPQGDVGLANDNEWTGDQIFVSEMIVTGDRVFDIRGYPTWDSIAADNDTAAAAAVAAAESAGGGTVLIPRLLQISDRLVVPHGVDLKGLGGLPQPYGQSVILCTDSGSGVDFGAPGAGSGGGVSSEFTIDGDDVAESPMRCYTGTRTYLNIDVERGIQDGLELICAQNSLFLEVNVGHCGRDNIVLDKGAGGNHFLKCESHTAGRSNLAFRATGVGDSGLAYPLQNVFHNMILEYTEATAGPMVQHGAGQLNALINCQVVTDHVLSSMATPAMIRVAVDYAVTSQLLVDSGTIVSNVSAPSLRAFDIDAGAYLFIGGFTSVGGMGICYKTHVTATVREFGDILFLGTTRYEGVEAVVTRVFNSRTLWERGAGDVAHQVQIPGETVPRASLYGNGLTWYSSGSAGIDVNWGRKGAGLVGTNYKMVADLGMGVGNSAAATTLGSVTKKMEVFDAAGASLGFVPIYGSIT